jgi:hypothetical protein
VSDYPAGWYDDPKDPGQDRYWDGEQWTHDVRVRTSPGWYEDPDRFGAERYWDGAAWTDERRFVTRLDDVFIPLTIRRKEYRLVISGEHLSWADDTVRWDDVTDFDTLTHIYQGSVSHYAVTVKTQSGKLQIEMAPAGPEDQRTADAFATIVDQANRVVVPRILGPLFALSDAGQTVEYENVSMSPQGFAKGKDSPVPWTEYAGWRMQNGNFEIDRLKGGKPKKAVKVRPSLLGRWCLSALVDDHARRFSQA